MKELNDIINSYTNENFWINLAIFIVYIILLVVIARIVRKILFRLSNKHKIAENEIYASFIEAIASSATFVLFSLGVASGISMLEIPHEKWAEIVSIVSNIIVIVAIGLFVLHLADVPSIWFEKLVSKSESKMNKMFLPVIRKTIRAVIIVLTLVQIIDVVIDKPITSLIAGLGIGGLAVALAAQDTLRHFIGSFVLAGDKPFDIGDRVVVDGHDGPIEYIGLRSTRIRTLEGHLVSIPNGELANRTIQNIGKRPYIRRLANITITYDTPPEKIQRAIDILKEILDNHEGMDEEYPPRVYFNDLNSDSLNIMMIYWYFPPDYWKYMDFTEKVNFEIFKRFGEEGIDFAFPTQTMYLAGDPNRPLNVGINKE